jgi:eukaryotic-like serine/threonine-protein kinase
MPHDRYELGALLGRGGMGQVHIARHRSGREVAVKRVRNTLLNDRLIVERLVDEARLLQTVSHPNVVRMLDHGTGSDGMPFLVMDRAHGTALNQLVAEHGALPLERILVIASQLFAGLAAIHDARIVHADLKSHNVLVDDVDIVTIIDFGLARTVTKNDVSNGLIAGTPAYMAPEMIAGSAPTMTADIYAIGVIIYEMLTGSTPFSGHVSTILTRQLSEAVEPPSQRAPTRGISAAIDRVVLRALDPAPAARFQTVLELATAFATGLGNRAEPVLAAGSDFWSELPTVRRPPTAGPAPGERAVDRSEPTASAPPSQRTVDRSEATISSALVQAQRHIEDRNATEAIQGLEAARASLLVAPDSDAPICVAVWRIEAVLASLYDALGKRDRARRMALVAYRHALQSGCAFAERRTRILVDRLVARGRRLARGSTGRR